MEGTVSSRYSGVAIALHWIIALLIALNFAAAWYAEDLPKPEKIEVMANHKAFGLTILALTLVRIGWRLAHRPPPLSTALKAWERTLAHVTHWAFYALMLLIPLTGWGMASGGGKPVSWFGLFDIPALPVAGNKALGGVFHEGHELLATLMLALFALHVAGALKHHVLDRDDTLSRMLPFLRRG